VRWQAQRDTAFDRRSIHSSLVTSRSKPKAVSRCACHRTPKVEPTSMSSSSEKSKSAHGNFPVTCHSAIVATRSSDTVERSRAYETLLQSYWKPSYKYIRWKWHAANEDSEDLTQEFFAKAFEKGYFERYDSSKASFHGFLMVCLDRFVANAMKAGRRQKRRGDHHHFSLDFAAAENEFRKYEVADTLSAEEYFHREWVRSLFALVVDALRERCASEGKQIHFKLFELYDLDSDDNKLSYETLAQRYNLKTTDVTNYLAYTRREFRRLVLAKLQEITATEEEFRREARSLLGVDPF
jgi:RNA polymerase sigma factor (sigma-70 family)